MSVLKRASVRQNAIQGAPQTRWRYCRRWGGGIHSTLVRRK
jgi:hypothetical protein